MNNKNRVLLLDTHVFLWSLKKPQKIGPETVDIMYSASKIYVSVVSLWELAIKYKAGKFSYSTEELIKGLTDSGFELLSFGAEHLRSYNSVLLPHSDPFDALLVSQSESESALFITADKQILCKTGTYAVFDCAQ